MGLENPNPNPAPAWLTGKSWSEIVRATNLKGFKGFFERMKIAFEIKASTVLL
jgi:dynein heavy chain